MGFFEVPPPPPEPEPRRPARRPWFGAPDHVVGGSVPGDIVVARTSDVAIIVRHLIAYPDGLEFTLDVHRRVHEWDDPIDSHTSFHMHRRGLELRDEILRFGVEFSDGRKATTLDGWSGAEREEPSSPRLVPRGGGGGGTRWSQEYWLWTLPPPGPLAFVCEWPAQGVELTRSEMDAGSVIEAAGRAQVLWEEREDDGEGQGYTVAMFHPGVGTEPDDSD